MVGIATPSAHVLVNQIVCWVVCIIRNRKNKIGREPSELRDYSENITMEGGGVSIFVCEIWTSP